VVTAKGEGKERQSVGNKCSLDCHVPQREECRGMRWAFQRVILLVMCLIDVYVQFTDQHTRGHRELEVARTNKTLKTSINRKHACNKWVWAPQGAALAPYSK